MRFLELPLPSPNLRPKIFLLSSAGVKMRKLKWSQFFGQVFSVSKVYRV